jgi:hypothetical protein
MWGIAKRNILILRLGHSLLSRTDTIELNGILSSEMDPAESRIIRQVFIKERGAEIFRKIRQSLIL